MFIAMVANSEESLQHMMKKLDETSEVYGKKLNTKKTKTMVISKSGHIQTKIKVRNVELDQVTEFCYLGSTITDDGICSKEIRKRIAIAKEAFNNRGELLRGKLSKGLKKRMVKVLVWSVALYAAEIWTLREDDISRLEAFEMWIWRKMEKISWRDHKINMQVLLMVEEQRLLMNAIRVRQRNWIGHILRGNSLLRTPLEGKLERKRTRTRIKMLDRIMTEGHTKLSYDELKSAAQDRLKWCHHYQDLPTQAEN